MRVTVGTGWEQPLANTANRVTEKGPEVEKSTFGRRATNFRGWAEPPPHTHTPGPTRRAQPHLLASLLLGFSSSPLSLQWGTSGEPAMGVPPVDWEAESYPAYSDFAAIPLFAVFLFAVRYLLDRFVFEVVMVFTVLFPHHAHFRIVTGVVRWREGWGLF